MSVEKQIDAVIDFWFSEENKSKQFIKSKAFDEEIREKFLKIWEQAARGELYTWRKTLKGRLAEIIVLDQFSRNLFRATPKAFSQDTMALVLTQEAVEQEGFAELPEDWRKFMLMPMMHAESRVIHEIALPLFEKYADANTVKYEQLHKDIIDQFGRYPYRNTMIGRENTAQEEAYLKDNPEGF